MKNNQIIRFLTVSLVLIFVLCVFIFSFLAVFINRKGEQTISEIGTAYMSSMSEQVSLHFQTTIQLRLAQMEALVSTISVTENSDEDSVLEALSYNAKARGFEYLALYSPDGEFEMIEGDQVKVTDPQPFLESIKNEEDKVAVGTDAQGDNIVLLGVSASYRMENGKKCIALVGGLHVSYISDTLSLDEEGGLVHSHIVRKDGSFVIRSFDAVGDNYFEQIRSMWNTSSQEAESCVQELGDSMREGTEYSIVLDTDAKGRQHLFCSSLPYTEWYLISVMPYGSLDAKVNALSSQWISVTLGGCGIVLLTLLLLFGKYYDLTRKQVSALDEARHEAIEANKAKSEFFSNMSHDIRTPMNAVVGMTAIAIANIDNIQQVKHCLRKISLSSKHLLGLINDVLDMSKIESGKMVLNKDLVSLSEVMDSMVSIVQPQIKAKKQNFNVQIYDIITENVCCDSVRMNQMLLNLLSNAIKFTNEGGTIEFSMSQEPSPKGDEYVRIHLRVKDNGIGIAPEFMEKIFESFSREDDKRVQRTEGSGLGMAITKYIVDSMGGSIDVQSELGKGTQFSIVLDLEVAPVQEADMVLPQWKMLVVDDDEMMCQTTLSSLKEIGIDADWTMDGESAVEMVKKRHGMHDDYQIILLDWKLPGIDGVETARKIREHMSDVSILLISAYDWSEIEQEARDAGVSGFIPKPLFKSTLFYGLRPFMDLSEEGDGVVEEEDMALKGRRVLVAEDNELNWEVAEELLGDLGLELEWAENGQICLEKFQQSPIGFYDAVLMDLRMPVMTGLEAAQAIRQQDRQDSDIPIVAMTADAFAEDIQKCLDVGMNAHVAKPIDIQEVARHLKNFIKK
ncbi:MAG: response regulator [Lachnospiraceae bacterium]|nr:response regulator [Lachnospiraceae bacterium]